MSSLIRCDNNHLFSNRRYGTVCPYCKIETETEEKRAIKKAQENGEGSCEEKHPVCGWIVCISGPRRGKDYKIREGINYIGQADDMDIQILGDPGIAKKNQGAIAYDSKKNEFHLLPGNCNELLYLKGAAVFVPCGLSDGDIIEMGGSRFKFSPFCRETCEWE